MPLPKGTKYRFRKTKKGEQRLAFKHSKVIEVVNYAKAHGTMVKGETNKVK